jgi:predicted RNase H-related nuclease YkuK (DUF458 family)
MWKSGSNIEVQKEDMFKKIKTHIDNSGKIAIGTDSMIVNRRYVFVTAICLIEGNSSSFRGRYFYKRNIIKDEKMKQLANRMFKETHDSIEIANNISAVLGDQNNIEIHIDVNPNKIHLSNKYESYLAGYATGCGYSTKIKPNSFAASAVADWHTRPNYKYVKKICP